MNYIAYIFRRPGKYELYKKLQFLYYFYIKVIFIITSYSRTFKNNIYNPISNLLFPIISRHFYY